MKTISHLALDYVKELEEVEYSAWNDFYSGMDEKLKGYWGINFMMKEGIIYSAIAKVDILAFNRAAGLGLYKPVTKSVLQKTIEYFRKNSVPRFILQLCPTFLNEHTTELLNSQGFQPYNKWVRLYRDSELAKEINTDLRIIRIEKGEADKFGAIISKCFGWPKGLKYWFRNNVGREGWYHYLAFDKDFPAATAAMFIKGKLGWLGMASTLPEYRQRGAQSALISKRIKDASAAGCSLLSVETAEDKPEHPAPSFHNLLKMDFHEAYRRINYIYKFR